MNRGSLFVITGPSGTGKGTVLNRLFGTLENLYYSVSVTTRTPRQGEVHGRDYHFITQQEMEKLLEEDNLLEHAEYVGHHYGTPTQPVEKALEAGQDVILEIEVQGAIKIREKRPDAVMIFIIPPSFKMLEQRLRARKTETDDRILRRLEVARRECKSIGEFDYVVINDTVDDAVDRIRAIVLGSRCQASRYADFFRRINAGDLDCIWE